MNNLTRYHTKFYANLLTLQNSSSSVYRLSQSMFNAQIDLNPHQVEAALFVFKTPLSNGVILADEVGLGKTIEAGLVICQYWSEFKRKIIIVAPASLRKQWGMELKEKFFIDSVILEAKSYNEFIRAGNINPFKQNNMIILTSYQFAVRHEKEIIMAGYDLAIIDEAHKLRNIYKKDNKTGKSIKKALSNTKKVLLTATPLQNSLLELFGLTSIIDNQVFGDLNSFKENYILAAADNGHFADLKNRLKPICHRTLRKDVLEYIKYTKRLPLIEEFTPSEKEQQVYELISTFLQRRNLHAIPPTQRALITLIMRKLLASSSRAIIGTLTTMISRLQSAFDNSTFISAKDIVLDDDELIEDYLEDEDESIISNNTFLTQKDIIEIQRELEELRLFKKLASSIEIDSKLISLLIALEKGFDSQKNLGASQKALIFTESRRTQEYLFEYLNKNGYFGKVVLFNGSNNDEHSNKIYELWLQKNQGSDRVTGSKTSDKKQALVDEFKNDALIMIATEAGSEGINLQFCNLVINYDLPWNPQRIEQRIGRCHRYGQKYDVVVVNFINTLNHADRRVFELLSQKFRLFEGVFGASDEVLGAIESGVDFEKRILAIYQTCREPEDIESAFDIIQKELDEQIQARMLNTRQQLLDNFDEDVHARLKVNLDESKKQMDKFEKAFWELTRFELDSYAQFSDSRGTFFLQKSPAINIPIGNYQLITKYDEAINAHAYRVNSDLGQFIIKMSKNRKLDDGQIIFDLTNNQTRISALESYINKSGYLLVQLLSIESFEKEEYMVSSVITEDGEILNSEFTEKLFFLKSLQFDNCLIPENIKIQLIENIEILKEQISEKIDIKNNEHFDNETDKLDKWADDLKIGLEIELKYLERDIKTRKTDLRKLTNLEEKVAFQRETVEMEKKRNKLRRKLYDEQDAIEEKKDALIDNVSKKLKQKKTSQELFKIQWKIV